MISYHHHSRQTPKQLGSASRSSGDRWDSDAGDHPVQVSSQAPEKYRYPRRKRTMFRLVSTAEMATPGTPMPSTNTSTRFSGTWNSTATAEQHIIGLVIPCERR
ncbi:unnamed protein product [Spirodela intermedia]|uniref:Uncharacterized protein n=2 Tax=Spirodela intermedia TaxID=51605 RepID=A0A7I8L5J3_SPIIN|nr:unnamed protein product [Spirodela intermedia]CAA6668429.1 unnamed protein product [Spirodela intermedia]CAA7405281.1 unnamed protein product [Spirodela intermedia]